MSKKYLLEIGVEELPARHINDALKELEEKVISMLKEERIEYKEVKSFTTPRRLTIIVEGLDEKQKRIDAKKRQEKRLKKELKEIKKSK